MYKLDITTAALFGLLVDTAGHSAATALKPLTAAMNIRTQGFQLEHYTGARRLFPSAVSGFNVWLVGDLHCTMSFIFKKMRMIDVAVAHQSMVLLTGHICIMRPCLLLLPFSRGFYII